MADDYFNGFGGGDALKAALRTAMAPNRLAGGQMDTQDVIGAIPRPAPSAGLLEALRDRAMRGDPGASGLVAQHDRAKASAPWFSSEGLAGAKPNALGSALSNVPSELMFLSNFLGPKAPARLPMDHASRMQRAQEQGYTVDAYHGTAAKPFDAFDTSDNRVAYLSDNPQVANTFAKKDYPADVVSQIPDSNASLWNKLKGYVTGKPPMKEYTFQSWRSTPDGGYVIPTKINTEGFREIDWPTYWKENGYAGSSNQRHGQAPNEWDWLAGDIVAQAEKAGLPGVTFRNIAENGRQHTEYAVIDPTRIRSRFAAFDPAQKGSANLLASGAAVSPIVAAALQAALMPDNKDQ